MAPRSGRSLDISSKYSYKLSTSISLKVISPAHHEFARDQEQDGVAVGSFGNLSAYQDDPADPSLAFSLTDLIRNTLLVRFPAEVTLS